MATEDIDRFREILTSNGFRITAARKSTFKLLLSPKPQTMREIIDKSKGKIDRVSIYRNIDLFEKLGIVRRINTGWKYKLELSDEFTEHHHNLSCLDCDNIVDVKDEKELEAYIQKVSKAAGFTPKSHTFEIEGYCNECPSPVKS